MNCQEDEWEKCQENNQDIKQNNKELNIKRTSVMAVMTVSFFILSFVFLLGEMAAPIALIGFFGFSILSVILLFVGYPDFLMLEYVIIDKKYDEKELLVRHWMDRNTVTQKLLEHKFECTEEGYYKRTKNSFMKDYVQYYVRMTDDVEIENAVRREVNHFDQIQKKGKNHCLLLFVYMDEVSEHEKKCIKEFGKRCIVTEVVWERNTPISVIVIAVERNTDKGYFLDIGKGHILTLYSHGCKILKQIFL